MVKRLKDYNPKVGDLIYNEKNNEIGKIIEINAGNHIGSIKFENLNNKKNIIYGIEVQIIL